MDHFKLDGKSDDFRAGVAYAAHILKVVICAPGAFSMEPKRCCQEGISAFAFGMADGLEDAAGTSITDDCVVTQ